MYDEGKSQSISSVTGSSKQFQKGRGWWKKKKLVLKGHLSLGTLVRSLSVLWTFSLLVKASHDDRC